MTAIGTVPKISLGPGELSAMMPMHLWLSPAGAVMGAGPTLRKICPALGQAGGAARDHLRLARPQRDEWGGRPADLAGTRLHFELRAPPFTALRGQAIALGGSQGVLLNLSFGIAATRAVRDHALTSADFAATDLTVELLYLSEVKAAVTQELAALNLRLQGARDAATHQALTDPLTGLLNRRGFDAALDRAVAGARLGRPFALAHLDLDFFKSVNDSLGHAAGDAVLARVAGILRDAPRKHDRVARIGGDEFVLLLGGPVSRERVGRLARRIIASLGQPIPFGGDVARISGSLGVALSADYALPDADRMLNDADAALYISKREGRARLTIWPVRDPVAADRRTLSGGVAAGA